MFYIAVRDVGRSSVGERLTLDQGPSSSYAAHVSGEGEAGAAPPTPPAIEDCRGQPADASWLKPPTAEPQPTPCTQTFCTPGRSVSRSSRDTMICAVNDSSFASPAR